MAEARARLQHAGEQLIEARATADERERGLVQDLEAARAESAANVLEAEAASQAAEERERALQEEVDAVRGLLADERRQGQATVLGWEERGRKFLVEIEGLGKEARDERERATKLEGELAAARAAIAVEKADWEEASCKLQESMDQVCDRLRGREQELLDMKKVIDDQDAVLVQKEAEFRALIGKLE